MNTYNKDTVAQPEVSQAPSDAANNGNSPDGRGGAIEEFTYDPVPPKKTITVSVRYRIRGRGRPLPYPLDEKEGE